MKCLLMTIFFLLVSSSFAQTKLKILPKSMPPPPGNIKLLPGYVHKPERGIDSAVGKISKENGLVIFYDIGRMAGNYTLAALEKKESIAWSKTQKVNNREMSIVYLKDGSIYANFSETSANFMSAVKTNEELADFLVMIMTYGSQDSSPDPNPAKK
jgi:hypothetical protein